MTTTTTTPPATEVNGRRGRFYLERCQFLPLPRDQVFPFFADAENLERITPDFLHFKILTPLPIAMKPGAMIDYRLQLFGIPFEWRTEITSFDPPYRFTDSQVIGPYSLWLHTHEFHEVDGGTQMIDQVDYDIPLGPLGSLAHWLFVQGTLEQIFDHRQRRIEELLLTGGRQ